MVTERASTVRNHCFSCRGSFAEANDDLCGVLHIVSLC